MPDVAVTHVFGVRDFGIASPWPVGNSRLNCSQNYTRPSAQLHPLYHSDCFIPPNEWNLGEARNFSSVEYNSVLLNFKTTKSSTKMSEVIIGGLMKSAVKENRKLSEGTLCNGKIVENGQWLSKSSCSLHADEKKPCTQFFAILPAEDNIVQTVVLAAWDNIVGPKTKFVWTQEKVDEVKNCQCSHLDSRQLQEAIKYGVKHTLHGELSNDYTTGHIYDKMFFVSDHGFVIFASIFGATSSDSEHAEEAVATVPHSLYIVVPFEEVSYYLAIHPFCLDWIHCAVSRIRILLQKTDEMIVLATLSHNVTDFCYVLQSLKSSGLNSASAEQRILCLSQIHKFPLKFMEQAISSHLQTLGCSVVVGTSAVDINYLVQMLALFLNANEQQCCRLVSGEKRWPYSAGLLVQGILKDKFEEADISSHELTCGPYPTTMIDVNLGKVRQSSLYHEHQLQRHKALKNEMFSLWKGTKAASSQSDHKSLFTVVSDAGSLVKTFLSELLLVVLDDRKRAVLLSQFQRQLTFQAYALIKCFEKLQAGRNFPNRYSCKILSKMLALEDEDFKIILAVAEKLKPGLYAALTIDSATYALV